jgi:hypothetical protein
VGAQVLGDGGEVGGEAVERAARRCGVLAGVGEVVLGVAQAADEPAAAGDGAEVAARGCRVAWGGGVAGVAGVAGVVLSR